MVAVRVGVLALQGAFAKHVEALQRCGADSFEVRTADELERCQALVIPGGESTTMVKLLKTFELDGPLAERLAAGMPTFGTCAGMILLADKVLDGRADQTSYAALDIDVRRNGYGRQINSFEADLTIPAVAGNGLSDADPSSVDGPPFTAVFIRAPLIERCGVEVESLAEHEGAAVLCRQGSVLVSSFHPELTGDDRLHEYFLRQVVGSSAL